MYDVCFYLFLSFSAMRPSLFYGKTYEVGVPDESEDENLESEDEEYDIEKDLEGLHYEDDTDDEGSEDEDIPSTTAGRKKVSRRSIWKSKDPKDVKSLENAFSGQVYVCEGRVKSPIEYYENLVDSKMKQLLVDESNKYAIQKDPNKPLNLTVNELEQFIGILYLMSIVKLPRARLYWSSFLRFPKIADVMSLQRFETIKKYLHCNDNQSCPADCEDKLYKIRPIVDMIHSKVSSIIPAEKLSIDEQIVPFKGNIGIRTYNPKKPKKWGYKIFVLSGIDGIVYNFKIYTGSISPVPGQPDIKASGNIVLDLLQPIPKGVWHKVYFDNWFNSPLLQTTLWKQGFCSLGTVRLNRVSGCIMPSDSQMKKSGRGTSIIQVTQVDDVELRAVKWHDNRGVTLLSNFAAVEPQSTVKRWDTKAKQYKDISCPSIVMLYNKFMGGVDLLDSLLALYRICLRSKKWYHKLLWHFFDMMLIQAWLLYRRDFELTNAPGKQLPLLKFKLEVADCLLLKDKECGTKRGRPSADVDELYKAKAKRGPTLKIPAKPVRTDMFGHFPEYREKKGRCKNPGCSGICKVFCCKCKVNLCFTPKSNCFMKFHQ